MVARCWSSLDRKGGLLRKGVLGGCTRTELSSCGTERSHLVRCHWQQQFNISCIYRHKQAESVLYIHTYVPYLSVEKPGAN